jgi:thioredoxin-like negative regulator of GroEL
MFFKDGEPVAQLVGFISRRELHDLADKVLASS